MDPLGNYSSNNLTGIVNKLKIIRLQKFIKCKKIPHKPVARFCKTE